MYDSILIAYSQDKADEILKATGTLDNIASFSLQKILLKNADNANAVYYSRVKDIAINLTRKSKQSLIPLIKIEKDDFSQKTETGESKNTAVFNATTTMLLNNGKTVGQFNREQTRTIPSRSAAETKQRPASFVYPVFKETFPSLFLQTKNEVSLI